MSEVWFYHLQTKPLEATLPTLVARSRERGWNVVIRAGSDERMAVLDDLLWTYDEESFLAHGTASEPQPETQPVLLTTRDEAPNGAQILFLVDGAGLPAEWPFERVVMMFDGNDMDAVDGARTAWKTVKGKGHAVTYWQQDDNGRWVKKA
ncbi:MAG: DNA polymerase III subunit chi [Proteobacteria bacterium]|nr:DNA polymerase III subunit chi [Pseudomonadota bacterium]